MQPNLLTKYTLQPAVDCHVKHLHIQLETVNVQTANLGNLQRSCYACPAAHAHYLHLFAHIDGAAAAWLPFIIQQHVALHTVMHA
jgi:hypothetical protein